jgi:hypothetical protein
MSRHLNAIAGRLSLRPAQCRAEGPRLAVEDPR